MDTLSSSSLEAWQRYVSTGALDERLLRQAVFRSWERAHTQGASPHQLKPEHLAGRDLERLLGREARLIKAARPYLKALSRAAGAERHAALLGNPEAVVLDVVGDEASVRGPEAAPGPGALLAESVSGSNGIGTPLAEGGYSELVGPEHFIGGLHAFTCHGTPLRGADGQVAGALSVALRLPEAATRMRDILVCAALGIEAELLRSHLEENIDQVVRAGPPQQESLALEKLRQDVTQAQAASRIRLQSAASLLQRHRGPEALRLLEVASAMARQFQHRARLFHELASSEAAAPCTLDLATRVRELLELLETEANTRRVALVAEFLEPCVVEVDARALGRQLLHLLMRSLEEAADGGTVRVAVRCLGGMCRLTLAQEPGPGRGGAPLTRVLDVALRGGVQ